MVVDTSGPITDDIRAENNAEDAMMTADDKATASIDSPGEKISSVTLETPNSNNAENVNESDSIGNKTLSINDQETGEAPTNEDRGKSSSSSCNGSGINDSESDDESSKQSGSDSDASDGNSSDDESDGDSDSDESEKPDDGISAYERLRIERIRRNEERLKQLGLVDPSKKLLPQKKKKRFSLGGDSQQRNKENEVATRSQPKRSAKKKFFNGELLSGGHIDLRRSQPLRQTYKGRFGRQKQPKAVVEKNRYSKRYRCGECRACTRQTDCHTCYYCAFNQRQGPTSTTRRRCLFRMCLRRLEDVEVEVQSDTEENQTETMEKPTIETTPDDAAVVNNAIDKFGNEAKNLNSGEGNAILAQEINTKVDPKVEGDGEVPEQTLQPPKIDADDGSSAKGPEPSEEKGENIRQEEEAPPNEKIPIDDSGYFSSYRMEEDDLGMPKWLEEFHEFLTTIPHGPMNRISGQKNVDNTMSQICKLVSGEGVTYALWPAGTHFKRGIKIHLGMNLEVVHEEAVAMERKYEDRRKGSLLRHPLAKMICYKEWIADGKPRAPKEQPMSPLLALPPPTSDSSGPKKGEDNRPKPKKRLVPMTLEDRIKPNRVKWSSANAENLANEGVDGTNTTIKNEKDDDNNPITNSVEDGNIENDTKNADGFKKESALKNDNDYSTTDDAVKNRDADIDVKTDSTVSKEDDKENNKELPSDNSDETKCSDDVDKDAATATVNEIKSADAAADKRSVDGSGVNEVNREENANGNKSSDAAVAKTNKTDTANQIPDCCAICSEGGDLICCDGCGRGFHSNCHNPKIKEIPTGDWFCKECKRNQRPKRPKSFGGPKREVVVNHKLFHGEHDDDCYICYLGGELICCDFCAKAFHLACHIPPLPFIPEGIWKCCECSALERTKKSRCGECKACTRDDCGQCKFCLDKPKFGGINRLKQVCMKKICPYPRFAPPASSITAACTMAGKPSTDTDGATPFSTALIRTTGRKRGRGRPRKLLNGDNVPINGSGKKRGRPRKSTSFDNLPMSEIANMYDTERKSTANGSLTMNGSGKKRGRPRKSASAENLPADGSGKKRGRPRKSVGGDNVPVDGSGKKRGRPRKSVGNDNLPADGSIPVKKKRGRPRKSVEGNETHESKRVKIEAAEEETIDEPIIFKYKISSFKSVLKDPESVKIRKVIKTALRDPSDSKAVDKACEHLRRCLKSAESVKTAILFGGVEMICNAMRDHPDKCILQAEACCTIAEMLWVFPGVSKKLCHMGAIDLIINAIHNCPNNSKVQQMGSGALGAFSYDARTVQQIMDAGGLRTVVAAVERFPKKLAVITEGCYFFQNLIVRSVDALNVVSNSQVIPILVETMSNTNLETEILLSMCGLIANLAVNTTAKKLIGISDTIPAVISVINTTGDVEVKRAACTVLKNLAVGNSANQTKISEKGGLDAVFGAIRSHPNDSMLLVLSFCVMKQLCINDEEVAYQIVKNGGIKIILKAMEKNSDLAAMQVAACEIIGYLLLEGKSEIHAPKFVKAIVTAMKNHGKDSDVQIQACDALFELSQVSTTRLILKKKETRELLLRAKSHFKSCESDVDDIIAASQK